MSARRVLYPHQTRAIELLRQSFATGHRSPVLQAPTAFGKAVVATHMTFTHLSKGGKGVLITVPRKELIRQTAQQLWDHGVRHVGIMQGDHPMTNASMPVQVATVHTLARRKAPNVSLVLVDECHMRSEVLEHLMVNPAWAHVKWVGLSATPWRRGMGKAWDDLAIGATTQELIDTINPLTGRSFLSPFEVYAPPSGIRPDLAGIRTVNTAHGLDYQESGIENAMRQPKLVADVVQTWKQLGRGRPTLVFAVNRAHARVLQEEFSAAGVFAAYIDGKTPDAERASIKAAMECGRTEVCVNIGCLTVGVDWPFISCLVLARPTKSEILYVQIVGRGLRDCAGKDNCLVLDHTSTTERLGLVTEIHHDCLDDGSGAKTAAKPKPEEAKPKECPKCHFIKPARTPTCPKCGFTTQVQSKVAVAPGKLEKVGKRKKVEATLQQKEAFYAGLLGYAISKGMKPGWAFYRFCERFDMKGFPPKMAKCSAEPNEEVREWLRRYFASKAIRAKYSNQWGARP